MKLCDEYNKIGENYTPIPDLFPCYLSDVEFKKQWEEIDDVQNLNELLKSLISFGVVRKVRNALEGG